MLRCSVLAGIAFAILLAISPISTAAPEDGLLLSTDDYVFLATQGIQRDDTILQKVSPKELRRLHYLINDKRIESNPQSRIQAVMEALTEFEGHQRWETQNPGRLWDEKKPTTPGKSKN